MDWAGPSVLPQKRQQQHRVGRGQAGALAARVGLPLWSLSVSNPRQKKGRKWRTTKSASFFFFAVFHRQPPLHLFQMLLGIGLVPSFESHLASWLFAVFAVHIPPVIAQKLKFPKLDDHLLHGFWQSNGQAQRRRRPPPPWNVDERAG